MAEEDKTKLLHDAKTMFVDGQDPALAVTFFRPPANTDVELLSTDVTLVTDSAQKNQTAQLGPGYVLKGRFRILEVLGEGGMGKVYKALDLIRQETKSKNPYVAIKVLTPSLARNSVLIAGLQREWEKTHELSHPNIVRVYDFDRDGDYVFMSMEYLVGKPLTQTIKESISTGGIKLDKAWPIIHSMGNALAFAHKNNIVNSDFKPANVFVTDSGDVKILDFGIASRLGQMEVDETIFDARAEGGHSPPYASFEMLNGSRADPRDDIYAFGLVVYELLAGKHPYDRKPASTVFLEQRKGPKVSPQPIPGLNRKQWHLLKSAIEVLQEQRPANINEWLNHFDPKSSSKWLYPMVGGVVIILLGVGGLLYFQPNSKNIPLPVEEKPSFKYPPPNTVVEPPLAEAENNLHGFVGIPLTLNGGLSRSLDGSPLKYSWRLTSKPVGSASFLDSPNSVSPHFTPDQIGSYLAELIVRDGKNISSKPVLVAINVDNPVLPSPEKKTVLSEATSPDGVLFLSVKKPKYHIGENLNLEFRLTKSGYLRVAYVSSTGEVSELLPNKYQGSKVKPDLTYQLPPKNKPFKLQVSGPIGTDKIVGVFSETPIQSIKKIANPDGTLTSQLQIRVESTAMVKYEILEKSNR